nr:dynein light chain 1, cytoplasmic isoform X2 [Anas platyrhynchos]
MSARSGGRGITNSRRPARRGRGWRLREAGAVRAGRLNRSGGGASGVPEAIMSDRKAVIKNADMSEEMQQDAVECATQALEKYNIEKDIAAHIKKEFDKKYNPTWHCIVGRNFGSYVTHETKHFIYFYLGQVAILLFKSG